MTAEAFIEELDGRVTQALVRIGAASKTPGPGPGVSIPELLGLALRNELEATEEAAAWLVDEADVEVKLALARQCGDEAKHYRLIAERLRALGVEPEGAAPAKGASSPLFGFLLQLRTTGERVAAGQFTREALAKVRNQLFIELCEAEGDEETARLYREVIQPDEDFHHQLGRRLLPRFVQTPEQQERARAAALQTLDLAAELQELARLRRGICRAPGC